MLDSLPHTSDTSLAASQVRGNIEIINHTQFKYIYYKLYEKICNLWLIAKVLGLFETTKVTIVFMLQNDAKQ